MTDTSLHRRRVARRLTDPEYRRAYERAQDDIDQINRIVSALDAARESAGLSKAELARRIGRNDAVVRRFFTSPGNPELRLVAEVASALGVRLAVVDERDQSQELLHA